MINRALFITIFCLPALMLFAFRPLSQQAPLRIEVLNIERSRGNVVVEIYNEKSGWLKKPFRKATLAASGSSQTASFDVPPGRYAVSVYQDLNENSQLDMNLLRIPKEPVGFGNNYKPFGQPKFESALIEHSPTSKPAPIKLFTVF